MDDITTERKEGSEEEGERENRPRKYKRNLNRIINSSAFKKKYISKRKFPFR